MTLKKVSSERVAAVLALKLIAYELAVKRRRGASAAERRHAETIRKVRRVS